MRPADSNRTSIRRPPADASHRIASAALELFVERSYEGTTTKAIATRAGTTERTLFKHFTSKELLFARTVFPAFLNALKPILMAPGAGAVQAGTSDFRGRLRALFVERINIAIEWPALATMLWRELLTRPAFRSALETVFLLRGRPILDDFIVAARRSGHVRELPTEVILRTIVGHLFAYLVTRVLFAPERPWDTETDADQIVDLVMRGIGGVP